MKVPESGTRNVLVGEDDPNDLLLLKHAARSLPQTVRLHFVRDGEELVNYVKGLNGFDNRGKFPFPDLILLDMNLPKVPGMQFLKWIRSEPEFHRTRIIAWSGSENEADFMRAQEAGAIRAMARPRTLEGLEAVLLDVVTELLLGPPGKN